MLAMKLQHNLTKQIFECYIILKAIKRISFKYKNEVLFTNYIKEN